jgi:hypothetical protein
MLIKLWWTNSSHSRHNDLQRVAFFLLLNKKGIAGVDQQHLLIE